MSSHDSALVPRTSDYPMVRASDAMDLVLAHSSVLPAEPLDWQRATVDRAAAGWVLAEDVIAAQPVPAFRASIMDGYAVVSSDGVGEYDVVSNVTAGSTGSSPVHVSPGTVTYITTGAPLPHGADAVQMVEATAAVPDNPQRVQLLEAVSPGQFVREVGSDVAPGERVLQRGERLGAAELGLLATVGVTSPLVYRRPRVAIVSTGDELVDAREQLAHGQIHDSNRPMLLKAVAQAGGVPVDQGRVLDEQEGLEERVKRALEQADIVVTTGGVSMGSLDLVKPLMERLGTVHFGRVRLKPGKPTTFATVGEKLFFGLPGNPVSSLVTFHLFVVPAIRKMRGESECAHTEVDVLLQGNVAMDSVRPEYHRAVVQYDLSRGAFVATSTGFQRSSRLLSARSANGLVLIPRGEGVLSAGSKVRAYLIGAVDSVPGPITIDADTAAAPVARGCGHHHHHHHKHKHGKGHNHHKHGKHSSRVKEPAQPFEIRAAVLTVSDRVSKGEAEDRSGPAIQQFLADFAEQSGGQHTVKIVDASVVPDEVEDIQAYIKAWTASASSDAPHELPNLILTTGGTGFSPRDVTPEATRPLLDREAPGLTIAMIQAGLKVLPQAMLSRPAAGTRGNAVIINLPGSPKAVLENLETLFAALPHAIHLASGVTKLH